jgi:ABC-type antimicrobial peptide transport system permease subunit
MAAVGYRIRAELRARWRAWLALAALVGVVAGAVLFLAAGARRTASAHDRFLSEQRAYDAVAGAACGEEPYAGRVDPPCAEAVRRLPAVAVATTIITLDAIVRTPDGRSVQPEPDLCYSGPGAVEVLADPSGQYGTAVNTHRFVEGRAADPAAPEEVVISQETARRSGIGVGTELLVQLREGDCAGVVRSPISVRVVGVQVSPGEMRTGAGNYSESLLVTPAFLVRSPADQARSDALVIRLHDGETWGDLLEQARGAGITMIPLLDRQALTAGVDRVIDPLVAALGILVAAGALAGVIVVGQILVHQATLESGDVPVLAALGLTRRGQLALDGLRGAAVGLAAAAIAVGLSVAASPLMPLGLARQLDPDRGFLVDPLVVLIGGVGTVLVVVAASALVAPRAIRAVTQPERRTRRRRVVVADAAARAGLAPAPTAGIRLALERGAPPSAVPVRTSVLGMSIAVIAIAGSLTFASSVGHALGDPGIMGWNWDLVLTAAPVGDPTEATRQQIVASLEAHDGVEAAGLGTFWPPFPKDKFLELGPDRVVAPWLQSFDAASRIGPSVITGRKPTRPDEIVLGPRTLEDLGLRIGDPVDAHGWAGAWEEPGKPTSARYTIVGTTAIALSDHLGRGATMTREGLARLQPRSISDATVYVRLQPGVGPDAARDAVLDLFPHAAPDSIEFISFDQISSSSIDLEQIDVVPWLFVATMSVVGVAVLGHVLITATRARRRDHAVMRVLGFTRGQTMRAVMCQAGVYLLGALAIGVPTGIVLGRLVWRVYADDLGIVPAPATSAVAVLLFAGAAAVVALVVAFDSGWRAARTRPADVLRAE